LPWPFNLPEKEGNSTQTTAEYVKLTTSFAGNFTAFHAYMDGFRAEGVHPAAHMVGRSRTEIILREGAHCSLQSLGGDIKDLSHSPNGKSSTFFGCTA